MNRVLVWFLSLLFYVSQGYGQSFSIKGAVNDPDEVALPYSTISLYQDSLVKRVCITDSLGQYEFGSLSAGSYTITASYLGYESISQAISLKESIMLKPLRFTQSATGLEEVVVSTRMPGIRRGADRYIVDMQNTIVAKNKNALQALNYSPGVIVGRNNIITLNGKDNVVVMLNGRKMNMTQSDVSSFLGGLRGDDIERIEVISAPGAQYDSEGQGGVIDIYLKKSVRRGISGSIYSTQDQAHYLSPSVGTSLSYGRDQWTFYGSLAYRRDRDFTRQSEEVSYPLAFETQSSAERNKSLGNTYNYRGGVQFSPSTEHTFSLEAYGNLGRSQSDGYSSVRVRSPQVDSVLILSSDREQEKATASYSLNYRYKDARGRSLTFLSDYTTVKNSPVNYYEYSGSGEYNVRKEQISDNDYYIFSSQLDFIQPLGNSFKFSVGAKYSILKATIDEVFDAYRYSYRYKEDLAAGYFSVDYKSKQWEGSMGLRAEYDHRDAVGKGDDSMALFPTLLLKYNASEKFYLSANYGKRINRAPYRSLVPYFSFSTPFFIQEGNPGLKPSIVHAFGFNMGYSSCFLSFNYDEISDNIYYLSEYDPATGIRHGRNANIEEGQILSVNLSVPLVLFEWWESFTNVLYRYKRFEDQEYLLFSKNRMVMLRSGHSFSLPADVDLEVTGTVMSSPLAGPMIKQQGGFMLDAGISRDFYKKKLNVSLSMEDITGLLNDFRETTAYNGYLSESLQFSNSQVVSLSVRYNFSGGKDLKVGNNKSSNQQEQSRVNEK
ncbi:outer membrane cobalamin receptor [Arcticibacter pallidicorallinus]|uniref:Outer membrane cobalamin receptor n=1 Tax=Arcticibacter pallidicorallinus TaxID=1259464 RepID=A0A2T0TYN6_9SPHI|nr:TonB dependent receptor [Arcticibacter pallidicorallinus]PRY50806.1 outer membrane cobalamin receptor [Arcticibacter pallidicorallinus]